ncbi:MAG TPA: hypothetical protein VM166_08975 [Gemmatimonadaceae bacterium]|jgi:hypothetical protein|nr:hypothetical protein [Gemmatimonadaceae bacterium]HUQ99575.1 hypothetical protein [Gemmatimonadaceae bacterium]
MTSDSGVTQHAISSITVDGKEYRVALRLAYDGVEYIGRLWFSDPSSDQMGIPDHGAVPGRTIAEAVEVARKLTPQDLERRCHRALADKRRYIRLRRATEEIITKIKYMNRVAVTMRHGMLDSEGASQELELIQKQIEEIVKTLPFHAGIEEGS